MQSDLVGWIVEKGWRLNLWRPYMATIVVGQQTRTVPGNLAALHEALKEVGADEAVIIWHFSFGRFEVLKSHYITRRPDATPARPTVA